MRTELGEKADGKYPLYWSAGDVVAINGEAVEAAIREDNAALADFTTTASAPFNIVYPYTEGLEASHVRFAAVQPYTEGTFAAASAPMYGYAATAEGGITMHHLTGIMRFAVKAAEGQNVTLKSIVITTDGDISGDFAVDCTTGALTPKANTTNTITYTFAEGEGALSTTASEYFFTIPAGSYGEFEVTFNATSGESMTAKFDGSNIKAGVVREFKEATFTNNANAFFIYDEATLAEFASHVVGGTFTWDAARVTASFEVTNEWTPVANFTKVFEGGRNTISGLTKPLFNTTAATIRSLNIKGAYTVTAGDVFGAVAQTAVEGALIEGCSLVEGSTITVTGDATGSAQVGGLVGNATAATLKDLSNHATITVDAVNAEANLDLGGIVGYALCNITNCDNHGAVTFATTTLNDVRVGGVVGFLRSKDGSHYDIAGCDNAANITVSKSATLDLLTMGGIAGSESFHSVVVDSAIVGDQTYTFDTCSNTGNLSFYGTISATGERLLIGGITGRAYGNYKSCSNGVKDNTEKGAIYLTGKTLHLDDSTNNSLNIAGIFAINDGNTDVYSHVEDCVNYAPISSINLENTAVYGEAGTVHAIRVAGLVGARRNGNRTTNQSTFRNLTNYGKITFVNNNPCEFCIGGVAGLSQVWSYDIVNHGDIDITNSNSKVAYVGGIYGYDNICPPENVDNFGDIKFQGVAGTTTANGIIYIGGLISYSTWPVNRHSRNEGNITLNNVTTTTTLYVAGNISYKTGTGRLPKPENAGNITIRNSKCVTAVIAGIVGDCQSGIAGDVNIYDGTSDYVANSGTIDVELEATGNYYLAGGIAYCDGISSYGVKNTGKIISNATVTGESRVSGILGYLLRHSTQYTHEKLINESDIEVTGSYGAGLRVGGCVAHSQATKSTAYSQKMNYLRNSGDITIDADGTFVYTSGTAVAPNNVCTEHHNSGAVTVSGDFTETSHIAGTIAVCDYTTNNVEFTNCSNSGTVISNIKVTGANHYVGGTTSYTKCSLAGFSNSGNVTCTGTGNTVRIAGICSSLSNASSDKTENCTNTGNILYSGTSVGASQVAGVFSHGKGVAKNSINRGSVTFTGTAGSYAAVGGVYGSTTDSAQGYAENYGKVSCQGKATTHLSAAGIIACLTLSMTDGGTNEGDVEITSTASSNSDIFIGGIAAYINSNASHKTVGYTNSGSVVCSGKATRDCHAGGVIGYCAARTEGAAYVIDACSFTGERLRINSKIDGDLYLGPIAGATDAADAKNHTIGPNSVVEIGGGASIAGEIYQDEYFGVYGDTEYLCKYVKGE